MFKTRLLSGIVLVIAALALIITGGDVLLISTLVISYIGMFELYRIFKIEKAPAGIAGYLAAIVYYLNLLFGFIPDMMMFVLGVLVVLMFIYVFSYPKYDAKQVGLAFLPLVYVAVLISFVYQTRELPYGNWFVWLIIIGASGSDTFAYLTGMLIGRHHFSELSPKKTIEGCVGGVLGTAVLALVYSFFLPEGVDTLFGVNVHILLLICGAVCSIVSQIGDLAASAIKRNYGIKDYSNLIPGHGGIMDRFDSILFTAPLVYYMIQLFIA